MSKRLASAGVVTVLGGVAGLEAARILRGRRVRRRRYRLRVGESLGDELRRALEGRFDVVAGALDGGHGEADVHRARTTVKRLRAGLRLLRPVLGEACARENAALRNAARALGAARDATVSAATLEELCRGHADELDAAEVERLRERLAVDAAAAADSLEAAAVAARRTLRESRGRLISASELDQASIDTLAAGLRRSYRRGRAAGRAARLDPSTENLHAWRRRVKDLRYQAELLGEVDHERLARMRRRARRLSDVLGEDHDLATLRDRASHSRQLVSLIDSRRGELQGQAFELGELLYGRKPKRIARRFRKRAAKRTAWPARSPAARREPRPPARCGG